jgi:hypothetical protein
VTRSFGWPDHIDANTFYRMLSVLGRKAISSKCA